MNNLIAIYVDDITEAKKVLTKSQIPLAAQSLADNLLEANSGVEAYVKIYNLIKILEDAKDLVKGRALTGMTAKEMSVLGATVTSKRMPSKWDYHEDTVILSLEQALKDRKKMLQTLTAEVADTKTGEVIKPATPIEQGETISVAF